MLLLTKQAFINLLLVFGTKLEIQVHENRHIQAQHNSPVKIAKKFTVRPNN